MKGYIVNTVNTLESFNPLNLQVGNTQLKIKIIN